MTQPLSCLPTLTVAFSTVGPRVARIALPPPAPGIDYVVTVQDMTSASLPDWQSRDDVLVCPETSTGLSANRNAGLAQATGALLLFCDDDIRLNPEGIDALRHAFDRDPGLSVALGWRAGRLPAKGAHRGVYRLTTLNTGRAAVPEIMIRTQPVRASGVMFDIGFGIGTPCPLGEDYVFVTDLLAAGLRGYSFPVVIGEHDGPSSGDNWHAPHLVASRAKVLRRVFGHWAVPIRFAYTWRHRARFASLWRALHFALCGR